VNTFLLAPPEQWTPRAARTRTTVAVLAQLVAVGLIALALFRAGALWSIRGFAQAQAEGLGQAGPVSDPFLAQFAGYAVAVLWPIPGAIALFAAARGFAGGKRWWWIVFLVALAWLGFYFVIAPAEIYYYWLRPTPQ
jgi:hypothetical protein